MKSETLPLFILSVCLFACTNDLQNTEVDLSEGFSTEVAVSAFLSPDSTIKINCTSTQVAFSKEPISAPTIEKAVFEDLSNGISYPLMKMNTNNVVTLYIPDIKPGKSNIYQIKIKTIDPVRIISVIDTMPAHKVTITDISISPIRKTTSYLGSVSFIPNTENLTNYYELIAWQQNTDNESFASNNPFNQLSLKTNDKLITREGYYPNIFLFEAAYPQSLLFKLKKQQNQNVTINFEYSAGEGYYAGSTYTWNHNIKIQLRTVSYAYFQYKTSLYKQKYAAEGDLLYGMASPVRVYNNINGGYGILGTYCKTDTTVNVEGRTNIEKE
jgi:hypothetical protein